MSEQHEPPGLIVYQLGQALDLLAALEDARDLLSDGRHLTAVVAVEDEIRELSRRLGFDDPEGGRSG